MVPRDGLLVIRAGVGQAGFQHGQLDGIGQRDNYMGTLFVLLAAGAAVIGGPALAPLVNCWGGRSRRSWLGCLPL